MQVTIVESILKILEKAGFDVTDLVETKPRCFEIVARKDYLVLLIKTLYNIDSLKSDMAEDMKAVAILLKASPLVVGERFKLDYLDRGVVYNRYGIPVINTATFHDLIVDGIPPIIYSAPGGYYVKLDSERIREARERLGVSLGDLAKELGISRRAVKKYEEGVDTSVENALKLEAILDTNIVKAINILKSLDEEIYEERDIGLSEEEVEVVEQLRCIGVKVYPIKHAPFDVISKPRNELVLTGIKQVREIEKRAIVLGKVSNTLSAKAAYIVEKTINRGVGSVVFLMREDLECISSPKDFISLINEKKKLENC
ncbi:MAG TPA: transcriptional regulator [Archaeoglobaceae archaeon]|nr:transcriptional regulator [Archaeoglobaceae archaeon]